MPEEFKLSLVSVCGQERNGLWGGKDIQKQSVRTGA